MDEVKKTKGQVLWIVLLVVGVGAGLYFGLNSKVDEPSVNLPETKGISTDSEKEHLQDISTTIAFETVIYALENQDFDALYGVSSPRLRLVYTREDFEDALSSLKGRGEVTVIMKPEIKTGEEWAPGKWADGVLEFETGGKIITRLVREESRWWLSEIIPLDD
jgi:hypothetical protein